MAESRMQIEIVAVPSIHPCWTERSAARFWETHHFRLMVHNVYAPSMWILGGENRGHVDPVIENMTGAAAGSECERWKRVESLFQILAAHASHATATLMCTTRLLCPLSLSEMRQIGVDAAHELCAERLATFARTCERLSASFALSLLYSSNSVSELAERARLSMLVAGIPLDDASAKLIDAYCALLEDTRKQLLGAGYFERIVGFDIPVGASAGFWCETLNRIASLKEKINPKRLEPSHSLRDFYGLESLISDELVRNLQDFSAMDLLLKLESTSDAQPRPAAIACREDFLKKLLMSSQPFRDFVWDLPADSSAGVLRDKAVLANLVGIAPL